MSSFILIGKFRRYRLITLIALILFYSLSYAAELPASDEQKEAKIIIRGCIKTKDGKPLEDIEVKCFYIDPKYSYEFVWERDSQLSDDQGQYSFQMLSNGEYRIQAGGKKATAARSEKFLAQPNKEIIVDDIIVTPASASVKGKILNSDGSFAAGLQYSCQSENFQLYHPRIYPVTDSNGGFYIPNVLEDEPIDFWVIPSPNNVQIWTGIIPDSKDLVFCLDPEKFLALPNDWEMFHYIEGLAGGIRQTDVQEMIHFTISDLEGKQLSLDSDNYKGRVVLVNIFGTWCGSCNNEIPYLVNFKKKYEKQGLEIIGISFEIDSEDIARDKVQKLIKSKNINYPVLFGGRAEKSNVISKIKGVEKFADYPTNIFIGKNGKIKKVKINFDSATPEMTKWQAEQFEKIIVKLLKESS